MILRFLRLFPQFRALEAIEHDEVELQNVRRTVTELQHENEKLQDRVDTLLEDRKSLWAAFDKSLDSERSAYKLTINANSQRLGTGVLFPTAPHLSGPQPVTEQTPIGRSITRMSDLVGKATDDYISQRVAAMSSSS